MMMTMLKIAITLRAAHRICICKIHLRLLEPLLPEFHFTGIYLEHIVAAAVGCCMLLLLLLLLLLFLPSMLLPGA